LQHDPITAIIGDGDNCSASRRAGTVRLIFFHIGSEVCPGRAIEDEKAEKSHWSVNVERVEHHTVETLFGRNENLYGLAATQIDVTYDGMDVGPITENTAKN